MGTACIKASKKNNFKFGNANDLKDRFDTSNSEAGIDVTEEYSVNASNGPRNKENCTTRAKMQASETSNSNQEPEKTIMAESNNEGSTEPNNGDKSKFEKVLQRHSDLYPENKETYTLIFKASSALRANFGTNNLLSKTVRYQLLHLATK